MESLKEYYEENVTVLMDEIITEIVNNKPENPAEFMLNFLIKKGDYSECKKKLKQKEKVELEILRKQFIEIKKEENLQRTKKEKTVTTKKRLAISSESYGAFNKANDNFTPIVIQKSNEQRNKIKEKIQKSIFFKDLSEENLKIIIDAMKEEVYPSGKTIIESGDDGSLMYFVEKGNLECFKILKTRNKNEIKEILVKKYTEGDSFGELALMYNAKRAATIRTSSDCVLWSLDRETFHFIFKKLNIDKENKYVGFLKNCNLFKNLNLNQLKQISDALKEELVPAESLIIKFGEPGDHFYILVSGEAHATIWLQETNTYKIVKIYESGDYFGELALIRQKPRSANIVAYVSYYILIFYMFY